MNKKTSLWQIFKLAGTPGYLLVFYSILYILISRRKDDYTAIDSSAIISAGYAFFCAFYSVLFISRDLYRQLFFKTILKRTPLLFFVAYTLLCFFSSLWSPQPILTAYRAMESAGMMILIIATIYNLTNNTDIDGLLAWSALYAFLRIIITFVQQLIIGVSLIDAIVSCQFASTIFFYFAIYYAPRFWIKWTQIIFALLSSSTTGYMGMALGSISFAFGSRKAKIFSIMFFLAIIIVSIYIGPERLLNETVFSAKGGVIENGQFNMEKTSGRNTVWDETLYRIVKDEKVFTGYGYVAGETELAHEIINIGVIGMHNGFLSALVGTGVPGLLLFFVFFIGYIKWSLYKGLPPNIRALTIASMCLVLIHTLGNPGLGGRIYGNWMSAMYIVVLTFTLNIKYRQH